jgi:hypothetical protein
MRIADIHWKKLCELMHFAFVCLLGCTVTALLLVAPIRVTYGRNNPPKTSIPKIAHIGKVQIGYFTQEELALKWGEGKTIVGGHPNSGRVWRIAGTRWRVNTDGFDYSERGLVVDQFTLGTDSDPSGDIPYAKLSRSEFFWLGEISLGMSRTKVLQILKRRSLPNTWTKDGCEINAQGFSPLTSIVEPFRNWKATLSFANDLLIRLDLSARTDA